MFKRSYLIGFALLLIVCSDRVSSQEISVARTTAPLQTNWELQKAKETNWIETQIGESWENTLGISFDGVATYRTTLPPIASHKGYRIFLQFDGVATNAIALIDGVRVSSHLGGWTPWRFDITERYREGAALTIEVDERVGHNTQGFLPVFLPHFGGIWQGASIVQVPEVHIDDQRTLVAGWRQRDRIDFDIPIVAHLPDRTKYEVGLRLIDNSQELTTWHWSPVDSDLRARGQIELTKPRIWSPQDPYRYSIEVALRRTGTTELIDKLQVQAAIRTITAEGDMLLLNGMPFVVRGVLNWGYAPPRLAPSIDKKWMRGEIEQAQSMGFNMIKFCLWIPPKAYLDLCDEMGMLAWIEYPTWHPKLTGAFLTELRQEYDEFFYYDRNHPSVLLRSLTCETGPSAELSVIQSLYDRGHELIPGSLIEDDSSWISWNRVHDFYDDHPYGNNHTWKRTLQSLRDYMGTKGSKPLVLGEAIAADTWPLANLESNLDPHNELKMVHRLRSGDKIESYLETLRLHCGEESVQRLAADARRNGMAMRRFQVEQYRRQMPGQGYVVSVLRDFPFATMGLVDFKGKLKWTPEEWKWHRDDTEWFVSSNESKSLIADGTIDVDWNWGTSNPVLGNSQAELRVELICEPGSTETAFVSQGMKRDPGRWQFEGVVNRPTRAHFVTESKSGPGDTKRLDYPVWLLPSHRDWAVDRIRIHNSIDHSDARLQAFRSFEPISDVAKTDEIILAAKLDKGLLKRIEDGERVLLLPDGKVGSPPIVDHWYLRGGIVLGSHPELDPQLKDLIGELQIFDLAGPVIRQPDYLSEVTPIALLWDNHDLDHFRTHALAYVVQVGRGRLLVSTLNHDPARGVANAYVLARFATLLKSDKPVRTLSKETIERLRIDLTVANVELAKDDWSFLPDPKNVGIDEGWNRANQDLSQWKSIEIGKHWDGQGFGGLDGWAWYAKSIQLPSKGKFITFTGVDDYFELFIDGVLVGHGGDREKKVTAFEQTVSLPVPQSALQGKPVRLAIRVEDWQGAGGVFRPVFIGEEPMSTAPPILVRPR